jgi:Protein of unknown function (DUF3098)
MADIKLTKPTATKVETPKLKADNSPMFSKGNYLLMAAGAVIIIIGMMIMAGGKSNDPKVFDYNEVYSTTRITIAPILIILGILVEVYAIFKKSPSAE